MASLHGIAPPCCQGWSPPEPGQRASKIPFLAWSGNFVLYSWLVIDVDAFQLRKVEILLVLAVEKRPSEEVVNGLSCRRCLALSLRPRRSCEGVSAMRVGIEWP